MRTHSIRKVKVRGQLRWCADISPGVTGTRKRLFAETREKAEQAARDWLTEHGAYGQDLAVTAQERALLAAYRDRLSLEQMRQALAAAAARQSACTVAEAVEAFLAAQKPLWSSHTYASTKCHLGAFSAQHGALQVAAVSPKHLDDHLRSRGRSARNAHKDLRKWLHWCRVQGLRMDDPLQIVPSPTTAPADKQVFSPSQFDSLLKAAKDDPILPLLVLGGMCGLRYTECLRAKCEHIKGGQIYVPNLKTARKGLRERWATLEPAAVAWLERLSLPKTGRIVPLNDANARRHRKDVLTKARLQWDHNILRRSFASHHLAAFEQAARTAAILGHTSAETTYAKYYRAIPKQAGLDWFAILPQ